MTVSVPGRVNLIGEHIDYHGLPVLPMAIQRRVTIAFQPVGDHSVSATSPDYGARSFQLDDAVPFASGDWGNYLKAAARLVTRRWILSKGIVASIDSDLPSAAGLSSSSALMTGVALALLRANNIEPTVEELMEVLPEGEQFVGTRGGGMDHAAVLAARPGCALLVHFDPFRYEPIPIPLGWTFLVAHSLTHAQKSGAVREQYNVRREAGSSAFRKGGKGLTDQERNAYLHVTSEARRVEAALKALRQDHIEEFGSLLSTSHASLRDQLDVSNPTLDELVECAQESGVLGARVTGAGFGGCVLVLGRTADRDRVRARLIDRFYRSRSGFVESKHLIDVVPSAGALYV
jgi:galactokinase